MYCGKIGVPISTISVLLFACDSNLTGPEQNGALMWGLEYGACTGTYTEEVTRMRTSSPCLTREREHENPIPDK